MTNSPEGEVKEIEMIIRIRRQSLSRTQMKMTARDTLMMRAIKRGRDATLLLIIKRGLLWIRFPKGIQIRRIRKESTILTGTGHDHREKDITKIKKWMKGQKEDKRNC